MKKQFFMMLVALMSLSTFAQIAKSTKNVNAENNIAIKGYDPVAYFESNKAIKGNKEIAATFQEVIYLFSAENNKAIFLKNPNQYIPQYGGFCAFGMSKGYEAAINPEAFTVVDNKLYLNYNLKVKEKWLEDKDGMILKANENWNK